MAYTYICDNCGEEFSRTWKGGKLKFCSRECSAEYHSGKKVTITCDNCGKEIERLESQVRKHNFCSKKCNNKWQSQQGNTEVCDWCGKEFKIPPKEVKEHNFCCHEHYAEWLSENNTGDDHPNYSKETVKCSYCGEELERPKWHREQRKHHFCDHKCYSNYLKDGKVLTNCVNCDKKILLSRYRYLRSENNFCSIDCINKWYTGRRCYNWKGGRSSEYYGPDWNEQRRRVIKRDNNTCQHCGKPGEDIKLDVHHKVPFGEFEREDVKEDADAIDRFDYEEANKLDNLILLCESCHKKAELGSIEID